MPSAFPEFYGLGPTKPLRVYRRNLPHWRQEGATYFVTFRLADSIPHWKVREWRTERNAWYEAHGLTQNLPNAEWQERYRAIPVADRAAFEHRTARQVLSELDRGHGRCILRNSWASAVVAEALHHFDGQRYRCGDFCVMPNHVHWLTLPLPGCELTDILFSIKSFTANQINERLGRSEPVWQRETYDRLVRNSSELLRTRRYIENNLPSHVPSREYNYHRCAWLDTVEAVQLGA